MSAEKQSPSADLRPLCGTIIILVIMDVRGQCLLGQMLLRCYKSRLSMMHEVQTNLQWPRVTSAPVPASRFLAWILVEMESGPDT